MDDAPRDQNERNKEKDGDHLGFWLSQYAEQAQEVARAFLEKYAPVEQFAR